MNDKHLFTDGFITRMESRGWLFVPTGPQEWEWRKFDRHGNFVAQQGSPAWERDVLWAKKGDSNFLIYLVVLTLGFATGAALVSILNALYHIITKGHTL